MNASKHGRPWLTVCATYHPDVLTFNAMMYNPIIFLPTTAAAMAMGRLFIDYQRELAGGTNWVVARIHAVLSHAPLAGSSVHHVRPSTHRFGPFVHTRVHSLVHWSIPSSITSTRPSTAPHRCKPSPPSHTRDKVSSLPLTPSMSEPQYETLTLVYTV